MNAAMAATCSMTLSLFTDEEIVALNNALQGFGSVARENLAYEKALSAGLIRDSGAPTFDLEDIQAALTQQVAVRFPREVEDVARRIASGELPHLDLSTLP